ncbi:MAG: hypothetical protein RLZZ217_229 [Planctomycetota bacterium]
MVEPSAPLPRDAQGEVIFSLPGRAMLLTTLGTAFGCGGVAAGLGWLSERSELTQTAAGTWVGCLMGVGVALIGNLLGLLMLWPPSQRAASIWASFWMGAAGLRMVATAGLAALLYFRSLGEPKAFVLATGLTYVALLVSETVAVAKVLGPVLAQPGSGRSKGPEPTDPT